MLARRSFLLSLFVAIAVAAGFAAPPPPAAGGFTLAVLPDTQIYAWKHPEIYLSQTRWIAENAARYHISYVLHLGDITQHNLPEEWQAARRAHDLLTGKVPCAIAPGNHDLGPGGKSGARDSLFTAMFPLAEFKAMPGFGGVYDQEPDHTENNFHLFTAGGRNWLVLALEFGPRDDVLRWAGDVADRYPDRSAILITHAYLRPDGTRFDRHEPFTDADKSFDQSGATPPNKGFDRYKLSHAPGGFNDGGDIWRKLVSPRANFVLVVCGHDCISSRLTSTGEHGNPVHQMMVDYQTQHDGGDGFMRLLQFLPDGKTLRVRDYSPVLDETNATPERVYELTLPPAPAARRGE
jgi:calcineurin-like phosphoesterase family protein